MLYFVGGDVLNEKPHSTIHPKIFRLGHTPTSAVPVSSLDAANGRNALFADLLEP